MVKRKRLTALFFALLTAFSLTACNSRDEGSKVIVKTIGICLYDGEDPFIADCRAKLEQALTEKGYRVSVADCRKDQSVQNQQIDSFLSQEVDGLIIIPCMTSAADVFLKKLQAADIPAVLFHREVDHDLLQSLEKVAYVGCDGAGAGALQGELILRSTNRGDLNGDQILSYVLLQGEPDRVDTLQRTENVLLALRRSGITLRELDSVCCGGDQEKARQLCENLLRKYGPDIEVVICNDDTMALGALEAITEAGRTVGTDILLTGIGGTDQAMEKIRSGAMTGTVAADVGSQVETVIQVLTDLMAGAQVEKVNYVDYLMITAETAGPKTGD